MHMKHLVPALLSSLVAANVGPAFAQNTGPMQFDVTESALSGTVSCNGGAATPIVPVDASTTEVSGSNDASASNLSATACELPLYSIAAADDSTSASDTTAQDAANGSSNLQTVSLLGGLVTFGSKTESDTCNVVTSNAVACQGRSAIHNLVFAGRHLTGTFTSATTFNAVAVSVQLPGYCAGAAVFRGSLTVDDTVQQTNGTITQVTMAPVYLRGTLTCIGVPGGSMTVALMDSSYYSMLLEGSGILPIDNRLAIDP